MESPARKFFDTAVILAAIPAILYACGTAYRHGFLSKMRLEENVLDQNFHQSVYTGFVQLANLGLVALGFIAAALFVVSYILIPAFVDFLSAKRPIAHWLGREAEKLGAKSDIERKARKYSGLFFLVVTGLISLIFLLAHFESKGADRAHKLLTEMKSPEAEERRFIYFTNDNVAYKLFFITCGLRNCADYQQETGRIVYFPQGLMSFKE